MSKESASKMEGGYSYATKNSIYYKWEIQGITSFIESAKSGVNQSRNEIKSPEFSSGAKMNDSWFLKLIIDRDECDSSEEKRDFVSIFLVSNNEGRKVRTSYVLSILNKKKETKFHILSIHDKFKYGKNYIPWCHRVFEGSNQCFDYRWFVHITTLLENKEELVNNDTLTVCIELNVYDDYVGINNTIGSFKKYEPNLYDDLRNLLVAKKKCDVTINVGEEKFDAHKLILIARSSVFEAMFFHNLKENKDSEITIPDVDPEVFKKLLEFMYTDKLDDLDDFAEELLKMSDKYQLQTLKEMCEDSLSKTLDLNNVLRVLVLAELHNAKRLMDFAMKYVVVNFGNFKNSEDSKALRESQPSLWLDIVTKYFDGFYIQ